MSSPEHIIDGKMHVKNVFICKSLRHSGQDYQKNGQSNVSEAKLKAPILWRPKTVVVAVCATGPRVVLEPAKANSGFNAPSFPRSCVCLFGYRPRITGDSNQFQQRRQGHEHRGSQMYEPATESACDVLIG